MNELFAINRRDALARMGAGMGTLGLFNSLQAAAGTAPHFAPRAKRVIHLFMKVLLVQSLQGKLNLLCLLVIF